MRKMGSVAQKIPSIRPDLSQVNTGIGARMWFEAMLRKARDEGPFVVEQDLTAPLANLLLESNDDNRKVIKTSVEEYANAMRDGAFDGLNGETIKISICGLLNDGQQRCHARLEAGVDVRTRFMFGLPREARLTLDQGRQRRSVDYLNMSGAHATATMAVVGSMLLNWRERHRLKVAGTTRTTRSQVADYTRRHIDQIQASCDAVPRKGMSYLGGAALIIFCHVLFAEKNRSAANEFIGRLVSGEGLNEHSPMLIARQRIISGRKMMPAEKFELLVRAWNAYRTNEQFTKFVLRGNVPEIQ